MEAGYKWLIQDHIKIHAEVTLVWWKLGLDSTVLAIVAGHVIQGPGIALGQAQVLSRVVRFVAHKHFPSVDNFVCRIHVAEPYPADIAQRTLMSLMEATTV